MKIHASFLSCYSLVRSQNEKLKTFLEKNLYIKKKKNLSLWYELVQCSVPLPTLDLQEILLAYKKTPNIYLGKNIKESNKSIMMIRTSKMFSKIGKFWFLKDTIGSFRNYVT